jgi:hypothetical protein
VVFLRLSLALHPQGFFIGDPMKPQILMLKLGDFAPSSRTITPQGFLFCTAAKLSKAAQVR